jgi:tRNA (Thr-GGU) A37 N-methylase
MPPAAAPPPPGGDTNPDDIPRVPAVELRPIGHVRTAYRDMADTPIQTLRNPDEPGRLVVFDQYVPGLGGLEEFDYAHLICLLDRAWQLDRIRGGWYQRTNAAANVLVRPGRRGLETAGLLEPPQPSGRADEDD